MNLQQCVGINKKLTSIDNMLLQSCNSLKNLSNEFTEQCEVINDICKSVEEQRKRVVELQNIQLATQGNCIVEDSEIIQKLLNSNDWKDRLAVAKLGFHLDKLKNDIDRDVRREVAYQGAYLHELKNDPDWSVRCEVVRKGAYLEELKDDNDPDVRLEVIQQGAYLNELKDDHNERVRHAARQKLKELEEQEAHNGDEPQS